MTQFVTMVYVVGGPFDGVTFISGPYDFLSEAETEKVILDPFGTTEVVPLNKSAEAIATALLI